MSTKTLSQADWHRLLGANETKLPGACEQAINNFNTKHQVLLGAEQDAVVLRVLKTLYSDLEMTGPHRHQRWEDGWAENLREFVDSNYDPKTLVPKFVKNNEPIRLDGHYVIPEEPAFETNFVTALRNYLFTRWFNDLPGVYEFGCGTGHNLVAFSRLFPEVPLVGLDWATPSQEILGLLNKHRGINITGRRFDLFAPERELQLIPGSAVFTIGTLEQLGKNFATFLDWLLTQPFAVCINIETLYELYDQNQLFDYLGAKYLEKRNYLHGYLTELKKREQAGQIRIKQVQRTFGSLYHDGYSYIVWEKVR